MNKSIYTGYEVELATLKSIYSDTQYGSNSIVILGGERGVGKTTLIYNFLKKIKRTDIAPIYDINNIDSIANSQNIIWIDNTQSLPSSSLKILTQFTKNLRENPRGIMAIFTYTTISGTSNASFLAFVSEATVGECVEDICTINDMQLKPLKLTDVHFLLSKIYPNNAFDSKLANLLHKTTNGNPLCIIQALDYLSQQQYIICEIDNKWVMSPKYSIATMELENKLSQIRENIINHIEQQVAHTEEIIDNELSETTPEQALEKCEIINKLVSEYKMAQALEKINSIIHYVEKNDWTELVKAKILYTYLVPKIKCLNHLGMFKESIKVAETLLEYANIVDVPNAKIIAQQAKAQSLGYNSRYAECFKLFEATINAIPRKDSELIVKTISMMIPFLLEYPLLDSVLNWYNIAMEICKQSGYDGRYYWETKLYYLYYLRYISKIDNALPESECVLDAFRKIGDKKFQSKTLNLIGLLHSSKCKFEKAEEYHNMAVQYLLELSDKIGLIALYNNLGHLKCDMGKYYDSISYFQKSLDISQSISYEHLMLISYSGIGTSLLYLGKQQEAEKYMLKSLELARKQENKSTVSFAISALGDLYSYTNQDEKALKVYLEALEIDRELNDTPAIVCDLTNVANVYISCDNADKGIEYLESIKETMPHYADNVILSAAIDNTFGNLYSGKGDQLRALEYYNRALETNIKSGDNICASLNYFNIGLLYMDEKNYNSAIENIENAVKYDRMSDDKMQLAQHLIRLSDCYNYIDNSPKSRDTHLEVASIFRSLNLMDHCAVELRFAGCDMLFLEEYNSAEKTLKESINILSKTQNWEELADSYSYIGEVYSETNDISNTENAFENAIELYKKYKINKPDKLTFILEHLVVVYTRIGKTNKAIEMLIDLRNNCNENNYLIITIQIANLYSNTDIKTAEQYYNEASMLIDDPTINAPKTNDDKLQYAKTKSEIGEFFAKNGHYEKGINLLENAIEILADIDEFLSEKATIYMTMGEASVDNNKYHEAMKYYDEALGIYTKLDDKSNLGMVFNNIGFVFENTANYSQAAEYYHKSFKLCQELNNLEEMYNQLNNEALMYEQLEFYSKSTEIYKYIIKNLINQEDDPEEYAQMLINLGKNISIEEDNKEALKYLKAACQIYIELNDLTNILKCQKLIAVFYYHNNNIQNCRKTINEVISLLDKFKNPEAKAAIYQDHCYLNFYIGEYDKALESHQKAILVRTEQDNWDGIAYSNIYLAKGLSTISNAFSQQITYNGKTKTIKDFCIESLNFAIQITDSENLLKMKCVALETLADIEEKCEQYSSAVYHLTEAVKICEDAEQRVNMEINAAIICAEKIKDLDLGWSLMTKASKFAQDNNLFEATYLSWAWLCFWILRDNGDDNETYETLEFLIRHCPNIIHKVDGFPELIDQLIDQGKLT